MDTEYIQFDRALQRVASEMSAAEAHGVLTGLLATGAQAAMPIWQAELAPDLEAKISSGDILAKESQQLLQAVYTKTQEALDERDMGFNPMLPGDDESLIVRLESLGKWCEGFLLGMTLAGVQDHSQLPGEIPDWLRDITDIVQVGQYDLDETEEDEKSYFELVEYVRMGVMLCHMELTSEKTDPAAPPTLH